MVAGGLPPPGVYDIPAGAPFLDLLAERLLALDGDTLAQTRILLPSRRACQELQRHLVRRAGERALLLPRLEPVGEVDPAELVLDPEVAATIPPAMPPLLRILLLARLVAPAQGLPVEQAVRLAGELATLLDELATEEVGLEAVTRLAPDEYAEHWQTILQFLEILRDHWPAILRQYGMVDPAERRRRLLDALAARWQQQPPPEPVIAAGVTGTVPAVARLLGVIARLPRGYVILPGLDRWLDEEAWAQVRHTPTHPQWALARLLADHLRVERQAVRPFAPEAETGWMHARGRLWSEVMRPAVSGLEADASLPLEEALSGLVVSTASDRAEQALELALRLRDVLETPGRRAILITPDRHLARRVAAELRRWQLEVDDTGGLPLDQTPPGRFLLHLAHACLEPFSPPALLAALQHPLARGGREAGEFRRLARQLERELLRGPRPAGDLAGLGRLLKKRHEQACADGDPARSETLAQLLAWFEALKQDLKPLLCLADKSEVRAEELLQAHIQAAENLARDPEGSSKELWKGWMGQKLALFLRELEPALAVLGSLEPAAWPAVLAHLMAQVTVRPPHGGHPRLAIVGQLESRLVSADLVILAGLEEGSWPRPAMGGPWLSRSMREDAGLPPVDQRIGFAAHDFVQAAGAQAVVLSTSRRDEGGNPTVASRWLQRLEAVLQARGFDLERLDDARVRHWARQLDRPQAHRPRPRPRPCPPRHVRPRAYHATEIGHLLRDPFRIYAYRILGLEPLEPLDADPTAADRGRIIHLILRDFCRHHPAALPDGDPEALVQQLVEFSEGRFGALDAHPHLRLVWKTRFELMVRHLVAEEYRRRTPDIRVHAEVAGWREITLEDVDGTPLTVTIHARADRIEKAGGRIRIIDYKTGSVPKAREIRLGLAPQLPVEAWIATAGGFAEVGPGEVEAVEYWQLTGTSRGMETKVYDRNTLKSWIAGVDQGLRRLLVHFLRDEAPYAAIPRPDVAEQRFNPYHHLARVQEWWGHEGRTAEDAP